MGAVPRIFELRQYALRPGRRDALIELFEAALTEPQENDGMRIEGTFCDPERPDWFVWARSFPDMESRRSSLSAFYGGPVWKEHRDAANATMIDSDNVLLLNGESPSEEMYLRGPLFCVVYAVPDAQRLDEFTRTFDVECVRSFEKRGMHVVARWTTEPSANSFPALPVRETENVLVALVDAADRAYLSATQPDQLFELVPTSRSRMQIRLTGSKGDFSFLNGRWNVHHKILQERLHNCLEWEDVRSHAHGMTLLDGLISVDEIDIGRRGRGSSYRHLDLARKRWSIYWIHNADGHLFPAVHGGFDGDSCELFGHDTEGGRDVYVRYKWTRCSTASPRWEQAFSVDGGRTWETNWIMQFSR